MPVRRLLVPVLASTISFSFPARAHDCDRGCLSGFLDDYLSALVANDASQAPLSHGFRQTENSVVTPNDEGLWGSVTGLGELQRRYYDPEGSSAGYFGLLDENGNPAIVALRLKVENQKITEAEWHIGRENDVGISGEPGGVVFDVDALIANPPNEGYVPLDRRYSRDDLIA